MKSLRLCICVVTLFLAFNVSAQYKIDVLDSNTFHLAEGVILSKTSFRGLSVVDDQTIWISGSRGTIAKSIDGGKSFSFQQLKGYEKSDFRDIEAFDDKRAIIMSSGTPAYILKTNDGGQTWKEVYKNTDTAYFLDAMDFWNDKKGMLVGDPINEHFLLMQTNDGGETWQQLDTNKTPTAFPGEAVFAASGTSLRCWGRNDFGFVTGGKETRFIHSKRNSKSFKTITLNVKHGRQSQGTFSFTKSKYYLMFVGGDYTHDTSTEFINFEYLFKKHIESNQSIYENSHGYKSSVEVIQDENKYGDPIIIATGTGGTEYGLLACTFISGEYRFAKIGLGFNVVRKAKKGKAVFLAGDKGKIGKLIF